MVSVNKLDQNHNGYVQASEIAKFLRKFDSNKDGILETRAVTGDRNNIERASKAIGMNLYYFLGPKKKQPPKGFDGCNISVELAGEIIRKGLWKALGRKPTMAERKQGLSNEQFTALVEGKKSSQVAEADIEVNDASKAGTAE